MLWIFDGGSRTLEMASKQSQPFWQPINVNQLSIICYLLWIFTLVFIINLLLSPSLYTSNTSNFLFLSGSPINSIFPLKSLMACTLNQTWTPITTYIRASLILGLSWSSQIAVQRLRSHQDKISLIFILSIPVWQLLYLSFPWTTQILLRQRPSEEIKTSCG